MYRIFAMSEACRVYHLEGDKWSVLNSPTSLSFSDLLAARSYVKRSFFPASPDGTAFVDSYIGEVDTDGRLLRAHTLLQIATRKDG